MTGVKILSGTAFSIADGKGRFAIPASMRQFLREDSAGEARLCLAAHDRYGCALAFGLNHKQRLYDEVERTAAAAEARGQPYDAEAAYFTRLAQVEDVNCDDAGRFFLPRSVRDHSGIDDVAMFSGLGKYLQVWKPERILEMDAPFALLHDTVRRFLDGRGAT